jgi:hypothetical protein
VRVVTDDLSNSEVLTILGAGIGSAELLEPLMHADDRAIRVLVLSAELVTSTPAGLKRGRHELSSAARSFKAQALRSVGLGTRVQATEAFWVGDAIGTLPSHCSVTEQQPLVGARPIKLVGGFSSG